MTQMALSQNSQLSKAYVSFVENGVRQPSRKVVTRLAEGLGPGETGLLDELLMLAGFAPAGKQSSDQPYLSAAHSAESAQPKDFSDFLQHCLKLIRHQEFKRAEQALESALIRFRKPVQLKALLAHLELARSSFEQAILFQKAALHDYDLTPDEQIEGLTLVDVVLNLGVMHYLWADHALFKSFDQPQDLSLRELARARYRLALTYYEQALELDSDNLYALDEAGRVHVNLADLLQGSEAEQHWQACVACFRRVLAHPDKRLQLEVITLRESMAFLALAYAKQQDFALANLLIDALFIDAEGPWIVPYVQACSAALAYRLRPERTLCNQALSALANALKLDSETVQATFALDAERDFKALMQDFGAEFKQMMQATT